MERFDKRNNENKAARWLLMMDVLRLFRPGIIRSLGGAQKLNYYGMFKHSLLISFRSFIRYKTSFLINLFGLSTGFASVILILLWIQNEYAVDSFNADDERLYRVMTHFQLPDKKVTWEYTSGMLASSMIETYPEVEKSTRVNNKFFIPKGVVSYENNNQEVVGQFADPSILSVFSYELLIGNPNSVISDNSSVILSEKLAEKLFAKPELAIGKTIEWDCDLFNKTFTITGIFKSPPPNATRQFELMINYENLIEVDQWAGHWKGGYAETYIVLKEGVDQTKFEGKIADHYDDKIGNERFTVFLQKYSDWYLFDQFEDGRLIGGRIANVKLFSFIAIFILIIAVINFINLSTAQASIKLKEIGVKKAMGSSRGNLIFQFLIESILMAFMAMMISLFLVYSLLPFYNHLIGHELNLDLVDSLPYLITASLLIGLFAGSYPALYLSSFKPIAIMRGKLPSQAMEIWMRKGLVVAQFGLSVVFIVGMLVVKSQLSFIQEKPLGYNRQNLLTFSGKGAEQVEPANLVNDIKQIAGVKNVTSMAGSFLWGNDNASGYIWGDDASTRNYLFKSPKIGYGTIETLELEMVAGRSFDPAFNDKPDRIIINESAARMMQLGDPVGHKLRYGDDDFREIIGVVKDFQYGSLHQPVEPLIFRFRRWGHDYIVRIEPGSEMQVIEKIEEKYKSYFPKYTFDATFLEEEYDALYIAEQRVGDLSNYFALFAIIISSLGLLGLVTFTVERRVKEIGIRKVLGCSVQGLVFILSWDFTKMILLAIIVSYSFQLFWCKPMAAKLRIPHRSSLVVLPGRGDNCLGNRLDDHKYEDC